MFGRAGRPQFDTRGFVFALAHEDDVKIARWRQKYDQIPENTKDPGLMKAKKALKKKMPKRRTNQQYWNEKQFLQLQEAKAARATVEAQLAEVRSRAAKEKERKAEAKRQLAAKTVSV